MQGTVKATLPLSLRYGDFPVPLMVAISALFVQSILNDTELKDMSIYTIVFDIITLGYIFIKSLNSVVKAANIKLLYIPAAFGLLWSNYYIF